jgi:hypothetical protein
VRLPLAAPEAYPACAEADGGNAIAHRNVRNLSAYVCYVAAELMPENGAFLPFAFIYMKV